MLPNDVAIMAGAAACLACESGVAVQDVDYPALSRRLLDDGQVLPYFLAQSWKKQDLGGASD